MKHLIRSGLVVIGLLTAATAYAHPELVQTTPAANATTAAPARIELRFSERLVTAFSSAELLMVDMPGMKMDKPSKEAATSAIGPDGKTLTIVPARSLSPGAYRVDYRVVAADTHRVTGSFTFRVQ